MKFDDSSPMSASTILDLAARRFSFCISSASTADSSLFVMAPMVPLLVDISLIPVSKSSRICLNSVISTAVSTPFVKRMGWPARPVNTDVVASVNTPVTLIVFVASSELGPICNTKSSAPPVGKS